MALSRKIPKSRSRRYPPRSPTFASFALRVLRVTSRLRDPECPTSHCSSSSNSALPCFAISPTWPPVSRGTSSTPPGPWRRAPLGDKGAPTRAADGLLPLGQPTTNVIVVVGRPVAAALRPDSPSPATSFGGHSGRATSRCSGRSRSRCPASSRARTYIPAAHFHRHRWYRIPGEAPLQQIPVART